MDFHIRVVELADTGDLKSPALKGLWVRIPPRILTLDVELALGRHVVPSNVSYEVIMFIPIAKSTIDWQNYLRVLPTNVIKDYDKEQLKFDNLGTFLKSLKTISGQESLDVVFSHVTYSFGFRLELDNIYELNNSVGGLVTSTWNGGSESGIITADLLKWRNFVLCNSVKYQLLVKAIYAYFKIEKLTDVLFDGYVYKEFPFSLVKT